MLQPAIKYKDAVERLQLDTWFEDKYMFWNNGSYFETMNISENTWSTHQFVSINDEGDVIGYIGYSIGRDSNLAYSLGIINFSKEKKDSLVFGVDLESAITDVFERFKFRKLSFEVVIGNPVEKKYDRLIDKYGGRVIGTRIKEVKLYDNEYYDKKLYEILREDYLKAKEENKKEPLHLYYIRTGPTEKSSQKISYNVLEDAIAEAKKTNTHNVYDWEGNLVWHNPHIMHHIDIPITAN